MKFKSDQIRQLILEAQTLLAQEDVDETSKHALAECLRTVQSDERLVGQITPEEQ